MDHPAPRRPPVSAVAAVAVGGMIGAVLRAWFNLRFPATPGSMPWATLSENVLGAFFLGLLLALLLGRRHADTLRLLLCTGILGSFTTFSNLSVELVILSTGGWVGVAGVYLVASVVCGLAAGWLGLHTGRWVGRGVA
jgi:CrcB protein